MKNFGVFPRLYFRIFDYFTALTFVEILLRRIEVSKTHTGGLLCNVTELRYNGEFARSLSTTRTETNKHLVLIPHISAGLK